MKLLLFILGIALITASPTYRGLNNDLSDQVVPLTQDDPTALDDDLDWLFDDGDFDGDFDVDNNGENAEELLEYCLEEETVFPSEEEEVISGEEEQEEEDLLAEIRSDTLVSDIFDFAVSIVLSDGVQEGKIPNVTFTVTEVSVYNKTAGTDGDLYEFSCEATNNNGSVIDINLTVYYDFATARRVVSSYSYSIETTTVTQPGNPGTPSGNNNYTQVSEEEIDTNALIQSVVEYGVAQIYAIGTNAGKIPVADYAITSIVSVWEQVTQTGANYQCSVVLENNTSTNNVTINANFTISYVTASQQSTMTAYSYTVNQVTTTNPGNNTGNTGNNGTNTTTNTTDGFVNLSADEIANSAEVQSALAYGVDQILASGYTKGKIPQSDYEITKINSVQRKTETKRTTYKCNVELEDANDVLIKAQFTVFVNAKTQVNTIGAWSYTISNIRPSTGNYTALSAAEIASADVQAVLNFGADQIVTSGIAKGKIPQSDYNITKVNSIARKSSTNQFTYKCNVELEDVKEVLIKTEFYVYVNRDTQVLSIGSWSYNVSNIKPGNTTTGNTTTPTQPTNTTNTTSPGNTTTPTQPTNTTNTTTPGNTTTPTTGDYVQLTSDQIANSEVQGVLNYGVNQILTSGYAKGKIPQSDYAITLVNSVLRKNDTKKTTYNCSVELQDSKKVVIKANFTVNVKLSNQEMSIVGWSYNIYNIPKNNTSTTTNTTQPTTNSTTTTSNTTSSTGTNTTTSSNTTTSTNTTTPTTPVNTNTTTTTNSTNSTANDGFVALTSDQIANDAEVQSLLNYATGQIIQSGESKGKIPQSTYQISKVNSVLKKADTNKNTYKCDVELQDTKNVVKTQFTVWIKPATQDKGLTGWSYSIGPIGN